MHMITLASQRPPQPSRMCASAGACWARRGRPKPWRGCSSTSAFPKAVTRHALHGLPECLALNSDQLLAALYGAVQKLQMDVERILPLAK